MKKTITLLVLACSFTARAEFGVSGGATFNYKTSFHTSAEAQGRANDPRHPTARIYDDGEVHLNGTGQTLHYGYDTGADVDNNAVPNPTLTLHSAQNIIDEQQTSGKQTEGQPAIEIYWQEDLTDNEKWNLGLRAALRWQRIELDNTSMYSTTIETINHAYNHFGLLTDNEKTVAITPGYPVLDDTPGETITYAAGTSVAGSREIDADIFAFDFGPTLSLSLTEKLRLTASAGGTIAWIDSEFTYTDGAFAQGRDQKQEWLFGAYAGADLSYLIGERWGIFGGAAYTLLEDFDQEVDGRSSELQFGDSYTVRAGIFFR